MTPADLIRAKLAACTLGHGLGTEDNPCSIAAINLALTGCLTDEIPDCMSPVLGKWIISIQDAMPRERLNGPHWRALLPLSAGTGRDHEQTRLAIILDWMWGTALPQMQEAADAGGFGAEWRRMCAERTPRAAAQAAEAARAAALWAARAAALWAERVASWAARIPSASARAASAAASVAARVASWAAEAEADNYWEVIDPEALLERLILVSVK